VVAEQCLQEAGFVSIVELCRRHGVRKVRKAVSKTYNTYGSRSSYGCLKDVGLRRREYRAGLGSVLDIGERGGCVESDEQKTR
jgi:hypothetical protein